MNNNKAWIVSLCLTAAIAVAFGLPKPKYKGVDILSKLNVPFTIGNWQGEQNKEEIKLEDARYNFVSKVFSRLYKRPDGASLMMFILDAGNFHNPKVCFTSAGFKIKELPVKEFSAGNRVFKASSLLVKRSGDSYIITYWMCIDKQTVNWFEQKTKQFFSSLFNKKKAGLMMRVDMAVAPDSDERMLGVTQDFISALSASIDKEENGYIFGEK